MRMTVSSVVVGLSVVGSMVTAEEDGVSCRIGDWRTGAEYDLTPLGVKNEEFEDAEGNRFFINPCHPLSSWTPVSDLISCRSNKDGGNDKETVYGCQIDLQKPGTVYDIGSMVVSEAILPQEQCDAYPTHLTMELAGGDKQNCPTINGVQKSRDTVINFICAQKDEDNKFEIVEDTSDGHRCSYNVNWYTKHACPIKPVAEEKSASVCVKDVGDNKHIDLNPLRRLTGNHVYTYFDHARATEYEYILNVCQTVTGDAEKWHRNVASACGNGAAACQLEYKEEEISAWSLGKLVEADKSTEIQLDDDGVPFIKYTGGDLCYSTQESRSTIIRFLCEEGAGVGVPFFVTENVDEESECNYLFEWVTEYACVKDGPPPAPADDTGNVTGTFVAILFLVVLPSVIALYCIGGCIYNRTQRGARGVDQVPHIEILRAIYGASCGRICDACGGRAAPGLSIRAEEVTEDGEQGASLMDSEYE